MRRPTRALLTLAAALVAVTGCTVRGRTGGTDMAALLAYRERVIHAVKDRWSPGPTPRSGLVTVVLFSIGPDGTAGDVRLSQSSGDTAYDASALGAVTLASPFGPPPDRGTDLLRRFSIEFRSDQR